MYGLSDGRKTGWDNSKMRLRYPDNIVKGQLNLLDSHDVPRFLSMCHGEGSLWKLGCILLILMPGVPSLFYGDECGVEGVLEEDYRQPMPWGKERTFSDFICQLIMIRNNYIDEKTDYRPIWELIRGGVFAFARTGPNGTLRVIINAGMETLRCPISEGEKMVMSSGTDGEEDTIERKGYRITLRNK